MSQSASTPYEDSALGGWLMRCTPVSEPFTPTRDSLQLALTYNAQGGSGFIGAICKPGIVIDSRGCASKIAQSDLEGIMALARKTDDLPKGFQWRIYRDRTCLPINNLMIKLADSSTFSKTRVYGYCTELTRLKNTTEGTDDLPPVLHELMGLLRDARANGEVENPEVIQKIGDILNEQDETRSNSNDVQDFREVKDMMVENRRMPMHETGATAHVRVSPPPNFGRPF